MTKVNFYRPISSYREYYFVLEQENKNNLGTHILLTMATLFALAALIIVGVPDVRNKTKDFFQSEKRVILAKAVADFNGEGLRFLVMKVAYKDSILIEIYPTGDWQEEKLMADRHEILNSKDAHFNFQGNLTNLALADIDNDATLEILVPTYDWQQNSRLNVFKLRDDKSGFDLTTQPF